jgi:hypothetical protein
MSTARIPKEFYNFCFYLHQESALAYGSDVRDMIKGALRQIPRSEWDALRTYIADLLAGPSSDAELAAIYRATDAELGIRTGVRQFFKLLLDELAQGKP